MYLIIKDNVDKAKELLKTNRPYKIGDKITGDAVMVSKLAAKNPDVFELGGATKAPKKETQVRGESEERKKFGPKLDKMSGASKKTKGRKKRK